MEALVFTKRARRKPLVVLYGVVPVSFVAVRVGRATLQSVAAVRLAGSCAHLLFGEVVASNAALTGRAQVEAFLFLLSRVSVSSPQNLVRGVQALGRLLARCAPGTVGSTTATTSWLAKQSLLMQVKTIGLHGSAVSALASTAVQLGLQGCFLVQRSITDREIAAQQFYYDVVTALQSGAASVAGGSCGAVLGALLLPGLGTALGAFIGSCGCGFLPYFLRRDGPEERRERERQAAAECRDLGRPLDVVEDEEVGWLLLVECEGNLPAASFGCMVGDDAEWLTELPSAADDDDDGARGGRQVPGTVTCGGGGEFEDFLDFGAPEELQAT
ncbi:uncharacterized protein Tco025E_06936 [Trypanosoma conorhini]|uniref:Uncharacterized protein n=1 Tax=Trypanosoma conorhini TaxID=83891 RepID=A0A422NWA5_9TRYP|nr:uncharacterized protein Tco025E_06936 [Trypanosoma conorhini]RNF09770.1 hypothetical protein Tco025E_06936 [Trypanosoma conorhini]